jgi:NNP family nitrate/nitrite transporter-like MFS transporter
MTASGFLRAGHWPTLLAAFLYFDISFMVWVILGPLAPFIGESLHLTATQKGLLVATPLLAGSFFRPIFGALADRAGGRKAGLIGLSLTGIPLLAGWLLASSLSHFLLMGILLGVAGASFAVALPLASRWYPPEYQGLAMGIAGAGNSGTVLATLFMPRIGAALGWQNAFAIAILPVALVFIAFGVLAKDSPGARKAISKAEYMSALRQSDTGWFCLIYSFTFGGFVGLASFLTMFFYDQYQLSKVTAGDLTTIAVLAGSALRPVGGWIADRIGGYRLLILVFAGAGATLCMLATLPSVAIAVVLLVATMALLGMGNGAVFQLVPQRFAGTVGIITGLVGAAGGVGGFFLPSLFGIAKDRTGSFAAGYAIFGVAFFAGVLLLLELGQAWNERWSRDISERSGLFSYRSRARAEEAA